MTGKRRLLGMGLAVLLVGVGLGVARTLPLEVEVAKPERDVSIRVFALGTVEARVASRLGFELPGLLTEVLADANDRVTSGQTLARLDSREQEARVDKARANLEHAKANVRKSEAAIAKARALLTKRQDASRRRQALVKSSAVSVEAAADALADANVAQAELTVALAEADVARAEVRDAEAAVNMETVLLARRTLTAPYNGVILERHKEPGSVPAPGEAVLTVADPDSIWVRVFVDERSAGGLAVGQEAEVRLRSLPERVFHGRVARVDIESDRVSEERRVHIACLDCPPVLHPGEQAEALIALTRLPEAVLIPRTALSGSQGGGGLAWAVVEGRLAKVPLTFGHATHDGRLEVVRGLPEGALLATKPDAGFKEGRRARAVDPP